MTAERVRALLEYDRASGRLLWRDTERLASKTRRGALSVTVDVDGRQLSAGRLVWLWHFGEWPPFRLQHLNECFTDTRIENLGFTDKANSIRGGGYRWGVCVPDRWGPYPVATFETYPLALEHAESVREAYAAACRVSIGPRGQRIVSNVPSPWGHRVFGAGEWETRDVV